MECAEAVPRKKGTAVDHMLKRKKEKDLRSITYSSIFRNQKKKEQTKAKSSRWKEVVDQARN